jgi:membrane protein implicated in regulation of membrane protease activity
VIEWGMRHWKPIGALLVFLAGLALQLSGYQNPIVAAILASIIAGLLIWSAWPAIKRIRFQPPIRFTQLKQELKAEYSNTQSTMAAEQDFSVKIEDIVSRSGSFFIDKDSRFQDSPPILIIAISFRTNRPIQIASLHLEIDDPIDPRDIIKPDMDLAQGFLLPHILTMSETHTFQFQLLGKYAAESEHKLLLKVLAGSKWYADGPYRIH